MNSDTRFQAWIEALADEGIDRDALCDLEADLIGRVGRLRKKRDQAIRDMEASRLLPEGWPTVCERFGVAKSTVYKMAHRAQSTLRKAS